MATPPAIWPVLTFRDALGAIEFLEKALRLRARGRLRA
jgi:hypothetical protein